MSILSEFLMLTFYIGNRISLRDMPEKSGTNVYEMLREFQLRYYSAPLMTLAVESKGMIWTKIGGCLVV